MWHELLDRIHSPTPHQTLPFQSQDQAHPNQQIAKQLSLYFQLQLIVTIVVGIPIIWMSNLRLDSTIVDALCILKLNCQPPSIYNSTVLSLSGLKPKLTIRVGNRIRGIEDVALRLFPFWFNVPCKLKELICVMQYMLLIKITIQVIVQDRK